MSMLDSMEPSQYLPESSSNNSIVGPLQPTKDFQKLPGDKENRPQGSQESPQDPYPLLFVLPMPSTVAVHSKCVIKIP